MWMCVLFHSTTGSVMQVFRGGMLLRDAQNSIDRFRPFLILEINGIVLQDAGFSGRDIIEFLSTRSYSV